MENAIKKIAHRAPKPSLLKEDFKEFYEDDFSLETLFNLQISQEHDKGTRKIQDIIDHTQWLHQNVIKNQSSQILDLACGPGYYTHFLAKLGHQCTGIDISKIAINYATKLQLKENLNCNFKMGDMFLSPFPSKLDVTLFIYSVINQFSLDKAKEILLKINHHLKPKGILYLEALDIPFPEQNYTTFWYTDLKNDFFCENTHLCLVEQFWNNEARSLTRRSYFIDAITNQVSEQVHSLTLYSKNQYIQLLTQCGFTNIEFPSDVVGTKKGEDMSYGAIIATKKGG